MNNPKIVLVQPPIEDFYLTRKRTLPYGLASIAANIRAAGFDVSILDGLATNRSRVIPMPDEFGYLGPFYGQSDISCFCLFHEFKHFGYSYEHLGVRVREIQPFLVGISSLFTAYASCALKTAETIKKFYPFCRIVMGGHHPSYFPRQVLDCDAVDFVIRGEAETAMPLLCKAFSDGSDIRSVPGIAFKTGTGFHITEPVFVRSPDDFPIPAMDLIDHQFYSRNKKAFTVVVAGRGCPMTCSYCSVSATSTAPPFRQRPVENVVKEIASRISTREPGFIDFEDENLTLNKTWFLNLSHSLQALLQGRDVECRAMNGLYPPSLDREVIGLMKTAGFKTLNLSLGSVSASRLKAFKRPDVRTSFEKAVGLAQEFGLACVAYIIAAGPGQTAETSLSDLLYLARQKTLVGLSIYYPAPGSLDFETYKDTGIMPESFSLMRSSAFPLDGATSRLQAVTLARLARILNFMKHRLDITGVLPEPEPFSGQTLLPVDDRESASVKLLQWFLYDGAIKGLTRTGDIYTHLHEPALTAGFLQGVHDGGIKGVRFDAP